MNQIFDFDLVPNEFFILAKTKQLKCALYKKHLDIKQTKKEEKKNYFQYSYLKHANELILN